MAERAEEKAMQRISLPVVSTKLLIFAWNMPTLTAEVVPMTPARTLS